MEATCPHLGAEMSHADIEEYDDSSVVAVCPWHRYHHLSFLRTPPNLTFSQDTTLTSKQAKAKPDLKHVRMLFK